MNYLKIIVCGFLLFLGSVQAMEKKKSEKEMHTGIWHFQLSSHARKLNEILKKNPCFVERVVANHANMLKIPCVGRNFLEVCDEYGLQEIQDVVTKKYGLDGKSNPFKSQPLLEMTNADHNNEKLFKEQGPCTSISFLFSCLLSATSAEYFKKNDIKALDLQNVWPSLYTITGIFMYESNLPCTKIRQLLNVAMQSDINKANPFLAASHVLNNYYKEQKKPISLDLKFFDDLNFLFGKPGLASLYISRQAVSQLNARVSSPQPTNLIEALRFFVDSNGTKRAEDNTWVSMPELYKKVPCLWEGTVFDLARSTLIFLGLLYQRKDVWQKDEFFYSQKVRDEAKNQFNLITSKVKLLEEFKGKKETLMMTHKKWKKDAIALTKLQKVSYI